MPKLNELLYDAKLIGIYILKILIVIGLIFAIFIFFRWAGIKGFISFALGLFLMAFLILSKNMVMKVLIDMTSSESYIDNLRGDTNEEKEKK